VHHLLHHLGVFCPNRARLPWVGHRVRAEEDPGKDHRSLGVVPLELHTDLAGLVDRGSDRVVGHNLVLAGHSHQVVGCTREELEGDKGCLLAEGRASVRRIALAVEVDCMLRTEELETVARKLLDGEEVRHNRLLEGGTEAGLHGRHRNNLDLPCL